MAERTLREQLDHATNRLTLAHDVPSMATLLVEWAGAMAAVDGGDPREWVVALAEELQLGLADG